MAANPASPARGWFVVIGIDKYRDAEIRGLDNAVSDARAVADLLRSKYGYQELQPPLLDSGASHQDLADLLKRLSEENHPEGNLILYYAGHGTAEDDLKNPIGYLVPHDTVDVEDPLEARLLPMPEVRACLEKLRFNKVLAILDCCHAGGIGQDDDATRDTRRPSGIRYSEVYKEYREQPTRQAISSATFGQKAKDATQFGMLGRRGEGDHSPFAAALLAVLAADDQDIWDEGVLTATELMYHVNTRMRGEPRQTQIPGLWTLDGNQVDFLFEPSGLAPRLIPEPDHNPYRGLLPYEATDCDLFFGRETESAELAARVKNNPLVALIGRSGVGKSSLLRAGLIGGLLYPRCQDTQPQQIAPLKKEERPLRQAAYPPVAGAAGWGALLLRPQASPVSGLAEGLGQLLGQEISADELRTNTDSLTARVDDFARAHPGCRLLLALDQFEDLIFECKVERERTQFLDLLGHALEAQPDLFHLAVAYRTDNRTQIEQLVASSKSLSAIWNRETPQMRELELREMGVDGLRTVIEQPLHRYHVRLESAEGKGRLEDAAFEGVRGEPGALPLLSFTLSQMYEVFAARWRIDHFTDRILTFDDYEKVGGATGPLGKRADDVYSQLTKKDPAFDHTIRNVMLRMVQLTGEGGARPVSKDELTYLDAAENERVWAFVHDMEDASLLVVSGDQQVEPAHSALVQRWDRLQQWRDEKDAVSYLPVQRELAEAARKLPAERALWDKHPKLPQLAEELWGATPGGILWPGAIAAIRALPPPSAGSWLSEKEAKFVQESVRVRARSQLVALSALAIFIIGILAAMVFSWVQRGVAEKAKATAVAEATRADEQRALAVAATTAEATARIFADERRIAAETAAAKEATARASEEKERVKAQLAATAEAQAKATAESRRVDAEREARLALSRELAARSALELAVGRWETAQLLAIQSGQITATVQAFNAIRASLAQPGRTTKISEISSPRCHTKLSYQGQPGELRVSRSSGGLFSNPSGLILQSPETGEKIALIPYSLVPDSLLGNLGGRAFQSSKGPLVLIVGLNGNEALLWNTVTNGRKPLGPATGPFTELAGAWSPSGQLVVTTGCNVQTFPDTACGQGGVWVWSASSGTRQFSLDGHSGWVCEPQWLADGRIRTLSDDGTEREWDLAPGSELPSLSLGEGEAQAVRLERPACNLSDGQKAAALNQFSYAFREGRSTICIADRLWVTSLEGTALVDGLNPERVLKFGSEPVFDAQLSPDGRQIALVGCKRGRTDLAPSHGVFCEEGKLSILDARDGRGLAEIPVAGKVITDVSWSGGGGHLLLAANDQEYAQTRKPVNPRIVVIERASRAEVYTISGVGEAPESLAWSADNKKILAFGSNTVRQYFLNMQDLTDDACDSTPRNFTWDEWNRFMAGSYRLTCPGRLIPDTAVRGILDEAAAGIRSGEIEAARQRLHELNGWLQQSDQSDTLGVDVQQFITQTLGQ